MVPQTDLMDWIEKEGFSDYKTKLLKAKITKSKLSRLDHPTLEQAGITDADLREKMIKAGKTVQSSTKNILPIFSSRLLTNLSSISDGSADRCCKEEGTR